MKRTGVLSPFRRASRTISNMEVMVTPFLRAFRFDFWMVGPSAIGSVNGRPNSIISTTFIRIVDSKDGS